MLIECYVGGGLGDLDLLTSDLSGLQVINFNFVIL